MRTGKENARTTEDKNGFMLEAIGYIATALTIASFAVSGERRLRLLNMAGTALFAVYAAGIASPSVALLNCAIIAVHLIKMKRPEALNMSGKKVTAVYAAASAALLAALHATGILSPLELVGFSASLLLLYGMLQDGEEQIRPICACATAVFIGYSVLIGAVPLIISNTALLAVHIAKIAALPHKVKKVAEPR